MNINMVILFLIFGSVIIGTAMNIVSMLYSVEEISPAMLNELIRNNPKLVIIDVRTEKEYLSGHITNAVEIDYYKNFKVIIKKYLKCATYVVYCETGFRSLQACKYMKSIGFKHVFNLHGGYLSWLAYISKRGYH